ncbi:hypothetical protein J1N35_008552 [Gossypium stocksii]|uniref:Uncharacterized protein n=1 Tax=Gossypium stocksii TaxID=47602 RepID=A0A9D3W8D5_9ROSI|nr:hypothetical protein J1N35_008552 [Gossypium stocksii]
MQEAYLNSPSPVMDGDLVDAGMLDVDGRWLVAGLAIATGGITLGTIGEIISFPIPVALWDSNTSAVGYANTFAFFILSKWVILPTLTTKTTTTPTGTNTTPVGS